MVMTFVAPDGSFITAEELGEITECIFAQWFCAAGSCLGVVDADGENAPET
jgi:hypothetical protein